MLRDLKFDDLSDKDVMSRVSATSAETLTFGAIQLDSAGVVLSYNTVETQITGRMAAEVIGRNFFEEVAPCTRTPEFRDAFFAGVRAGTLDKRFRYTFDFRMNPTPVEVHLKRAVAGTTYWIFVKRLSTPA